MSEAQTNDGGAILPGIKPVIERLQNSPDQIDSILIRKGKKGPDVNIICALGKKHKIKIMFVPDQVLAKNFTGNHQGVLAKIFESGFQTEDEVLEAGLNSPLQLVLAMDQIQDPGNAGTLARSLYGIGGGGIIMPKHNASFLGAAAAKAAAGALSKLPVAKATNLSRTLEKAKEMGYFIYGAQVAEDAENIFTTKLATPAILVLGNEDKGIRPGVAKRLDQSVFIPMKNNFDSLNVAQAGAMMMAQFYAAEFE